MSDEQQIDQTQSLRTYHCGDLVKCISEKLHLNSKTADVHFSFGSADGTLTRIPAHKNILAAASDVFDAMFYGELKESGDVHITDTTEAAFMKFLQFFHLTEVELTKENIAGVMHLGHKYQVSNCVKICVQFLEETLTVENVLIGLNLAILYDQKELLKTYETFIALNTAEIFGTNGFLECDRRALEHILKMDVLSCTEVKVFEACMAWVRIKSKRNTLSKAMVKKHLGQLYYEIRFASMTIQEICTLTAKYDSVLRSDHFSLTSMIASPEFQPENFNRNLRQANWNENAIVECDRALSDKIKSYILHIKYTSIFSTNKPLILGAILASKIGLYKSTHRDLRTGLSINIEITEANDLTGSIPKSLLKMKTNLQSKDTNILLAHPVLVRPGFFYSICIGPFPDDHCFYSKELKTEVQLESDTIIKFHNCNTGKDKLIIDCFSVLYFNQI